MAGQSRLRTVGFALRRMTTIVARSLLRPSRSPWSSEGLFSIGNVFRRTEQVASGADGLLPSATSDSNQKTSATMSPVFYRREAERTRRLAGEQPETETVQQMLRMAAHYDDLADDLERAAPAPHDQVPSGKPS